MSEYDPRLVAPTCLYLAAKAEESTVQARALAFYIRKLCKLLLMDFIDQLFNFPCSLVVGHLYVQKVLKVASCLEDSDEKYRYEIKDICEMEMKILEALNCYLVVFHSYRLLSQEALYLLYPVSIHVRVGFV